MSEKRSVLSLPYKRSVEMKLREDQALFIKQSPDGDSILIPTAFTHEFADMIWGLVNGSVQQTTTTSQSHCNRCLAPMTAYFNCSELNCTDWFCSSLCQTGHYNDKHTVYP